MSKQGKIIGNVNVLDLRKATEETIADISTVKNVNVMLYSAETAGLVSKLNVKNVNISVETSPDAKITTGKMTISRRSLKESGHAVSHVVLGKVIVEADVTPAEIEQGIDQLYVLGKIVAPEPVMGVLQAKIANLLGAIASYPLSGQVHFDSLTIDEAYLRGLDDGTELAVLGALKVQGVLPNDLLSQKLKSLHVGGNIRCHQENVPALQAILTGGSRRIKAIPAGHTLVERPLVLDGALLAALPSKKLFCTERIQLEPDVTPELLLEHLESLATEELILCPAALKGALAQRCNLLETDAIFYEGALWVVEAAETLSASRFDYLEDKITLVVQGVLTIEPDVEPQALADNLRQVHLQGVIECSPEQRGALQARLGRSEGVIESPKQEDEQPGIGNANYLAL